MYDTKPNRLAWHSGVSRFTIYVIWRRQRLSRLDRLVPRPSVVRYERAAPGYFTEDRYAAEITVQIERRLVSSGW